jgi:selenocysteine-specific elongation factor
MGLRDLPLPVTGEWLVDRQHWQELRRQLSAAVTTHAQRDPLAPGLPVEAARAALGLPDRGLIEALAAWCGDASPAELVQLRAGYLVPGGAQRPGQSDRPASAEAGQRDAAAALAAAGIAGLPAQVAAAVTTLLADLAEAPFSAPDSERLRQLGLDNRAVAAAERAGLLQRLPGNVVLPPDAATRARRVLAGLPQPFTTSEARQALKSSRRVVIPLLEWLDRERITRRLPDDRRTIREQPG